MILKGPNTRHENKSPDTSLPIDFDEKLVGALKTTKSEYPRAHDSTDELRAEATLKVEKINILRRNPLFSKTLETLELILNPRERIIGDDAEAGRLITHTYIQEFLANALLFPKGEEIMTRLRYPLINQKSTKTTAKRMLEFLIHATLKANYGYRLMFNVPRTEDQYEKLGKEGLKNPERENQVVDFIKTVLISSLQDLFARYKEISSPQGLEFNELNSENIDDFLYLLEKISGIKIHASSNKNPDNQYSIETSELIDNIEEAIKQFFVSNKAYSANKLPLKISFEKLYEEIRFANPDINEDEMFDVRDTQAIENLMMKVAWTLLPQSAENKMDPKVLKKIAKIALEGHNGVTKPEWSHLPNLSARIKEIIINDISNRQLTEEKMRTLGDNGFDINGDVFYTMYPELKHPEDQEINKITKLIIKLTNKIKEKNIRRTTREKTDTEKEIDKAVKIFMEILVDTITLYKIGSQTKNTTDDAKINEENELLREMSKINMDKLISVAKDMDLFLGLEEKDRDYGIIIKLTAILYELKVWPGLVTSVKVNKAIS